MRLSRIFGLAVLATSVVGNAGGKTLKYGGVAVEYGSYGLRKGVDAVLYTTENIGYYTKETGKFVEQESNNLNNFATNYLAKDEYRNLTETLDYLEETVDDNWVLISKN